MSFTKYAPCCLPPSEKARSVVIICRFGVWRSLVAHLHGVQGVEGSNPFTPTNKIKDLA